jgi:hypothetical protein
VAQYEPEWCWQVRFLAICLALLGLVLFLVAVGVAALDPPVSYPSISASS